ELCVPLVMASIIDQGIRFEDKAYIIKCGLLLLALAGRVFDTYDTKHL
ncbi:hypothetical protein H6A09_12670, partial [[Clostridium] spiroforme]|nr:hypothetical protein [Thomasclavelia spiroformis]